MTQTAQAKHDYQVPMLPSIVTRLLSLSTDDEHYFQKVTHLAEQDPTLALRILKVANSALYVGHQASSTLHDAVVRIGIDQIHNLLASIAVTQVFVPVTESEKRLWQHSLEVACLCKLLASNLKECHIHPDRAYLFGLLHDLGLFLHFKDMQQDFNHIDDFNWSTPAQHVDAESKLFSESHAQLSKSICEHWGIPSVIAAIVGLHHNYTLSDKIEAQPQVLHSVRILQLSDLCSELAYHHQGIDRRSLVSHVKQIPALANWAREHLNSIRALDEGPQVLAHAQHLYHELMS